MSTPSAPHPERRKYISFAFLLVAGQSIALVVAASIIQRYISAVFSDHIAWKDALALLPLLPGFLVIGLVTVAIMRYCPASAKAAATWMRAYLLAAAILSWWLVESPLLGWATWAAILAAFAATYARQQLPAGP